ncbi:hypothetical protein MTO96_004971 [Rhipicephalus appendiculatus]
MVALGKLKGFPAAADMRKLEWDAELASVAQALAEQCTGSEGESDHDNYRDRFTIRFPNTGQNLAFRGRNFPFQKNDWSGRVRGWFIEHTDFAPERRHSFRVLAQDRRQADGPLHPARVGRYELRGLRIRRVQRGERDPPAVHAVLRVQLRRDGQRLQETPVSGRQALFRLSRWYCLRQGDRTVFSRRRERTFSARKRP